MDISFLLNGETVSLQNVSPMQTLLDWLRQERHLTGTKEGCNEGDCGACTVIVTDPAAVKPLNACILLMPQLDGKAVRTIEAIAPSGQMHPVQRAMIDLHGSQCGFCTPGFVMSMVAAQINADPDHDTTLAGNLCRCTGYAPIVRAACETESQPHPDWLATDRAALDANGVSGSEISLPQSSDALAALLEKAPDTTLIAGATDVGLWVTKDLRDLHPVAFLHQVGDLAEIDESAEQVAIGAMVSIEALRLWADDHHPSFASMLKRYGSTQVRMAATLGGNIANGSPIGDSAPALIALGASLRLRQGAARRTIRLEDFFIDYGRQDLHSGEFIEAVLIPKSAPELRCYKISKRFDQDISALCGCFNICVQDGKIASADIAFGGMAGVPKRAQHVEQALLGQPWSIESLEASKVAWSQDFTPINDMRASADYRTQTAHNLLIRYFHDLSGVESHVLEVSP